MKTALTLGFFDGLHLGHQTLLKHLRARAHTTILTFTNHPQSLFAPPGPPLLLPLEEKLTLLRPYADELIVVPFTKEFAAMTYDQLLAQFDLAHLLLGAGAVFGKNREGTETAIRHYAKKHSFTVEYLPKVLLDGQPISSSRIRHAIASGNQPLAHQLLGRP